MTARFASLANHATASGADVQRIAQAAVEGAQILAFEYPMRVVSEANQREHYMAKHRRKVAQQLETAAEWRRAIGQRRVPLPCVIRLTRIGCKAMDSDNLAGSMKHVQDAIAKLIGVDDGSDLLRFEYAQEVIAKRQYAVRVEVMSR